MSNAEALYVALTNDRQLSARLPNVEYRCPRRCLLLHAIDAAEMGTVIHQKRYKYSPDENESRSSASGRAANTYDGQNHWKSRTYFLSDSALGWEDSLDAGQQLTCDHVLGYLLRPSEFKTDLQARHTEVVVRTDGSRYALD